MAKYGNNPEFLELFTEFSKLMGGHFEELSKKKEPEKNDQHKLDPKAEVISFFNIMIK
jgi:hypothetical protein